MAFLREIFNCDKKTEITVSSTTFGIGRTVNVVNDSGGRNTVISYTDNLCSEHRIAFVFCLFICFIAQLIECYC